MCSNTQEKVAIVNSVLDFGSTGSLARGLYEYGKQIGYEPFVLYGRGDKSSDDHLVRLDSKIEVYIHKLLALTTGYQGFFSNHATEIAMKLIESQGIKKVILLNLHGYYLNEGKLLTFLGNHGINTVYVTPDEYAGLGKCCYNGDCQRYKVGCGSCPSVKGYPRSIFFDRSHSIFEMKRNAYGGIENLTIVGPETNLAKFRTSPLLSGKKMKRASWGVDLDKYDYEIDNSLYAKYGIPKDKIIVLTVANYSMRRKGVADYFFPVAKCLEDSQYHFINVGYDGNLEGNQIPSNMTTISYVHDQKELTHIYAMADLYLLASTSDTMPMSCLISFACRTPVCCFYTSGMRYLAPRESKAIRFVDEMSVSALCREVQKQGKKDFESMEACRKLANEEYSSTAFNQKVYDAFEVTP